MNATVELWGIEKWFGPVAAVKDVSLKVTDRQCLCLLGPSGCGKTTSLRMIAGLEQPDGGRIFIKGKDVTHLPPYERDIGMVFQDYALFPHMTVEQNIAFGLHHRGTTAKGEIASRVSEVLALVRLTDYARRKPSQLSGGQQQRIALARALAPRPAVLLLDEPLSNLDAKLREELRVQLREILEAAHTTTIMVTHDQDEAMALGDRIVVMHHGEVEQEGTPLEIYDRPRTRFVAEFVGRSNWLTGSAGQTASDGVTAFTLDSGGIIAVHPHEVPRPGRYDLCLRPERLRLLNGSGHDGFGANILSGVVRYSEPIAAQLHLHVTLNEGTSVLAIVPREGSLPDIGSPIRLGFRPEDALLLPNEDEAAQVAA